MSLAYAHEHLKEIAEREFHAQESFIHMLKEFAELEYLEAERTFERMKRAKMLKYDGTMARYTVKHGAYLDRETIERIAFEGI
jgi:hypothetical protein